MSSATRLSFLKDKCIKLCLNILPTVSNYGNCILRLPIFFFFNLSHSIISQNYSYKLGYFFTKYALRFNYKTDILYYNTKPLKISSVLITTIIL